MIFYILAILFFLKQYIPHFYISSIVQIIFPLNLINYYYIKKNIYIYLTDGLYTFS